MKASGVDLDTLQRTTSTVARTATEGAAAATPFVVKLWTFLTTTQPVALAE